MMNQELLEDVDLNSLIDEMEQSEIRADKDFDDSIVRSSSDADPTKYYDPSEAHREVDGKAINSLLPSRAKVSGIIIPRSNRFGQTLGSNPHKPQQLVY